ncbi:MAG: type II toxin-antitoxin system PemK/MazF family toxin [Chloroflexi bacterium]|nr:type II toxin-antitoxin system PemK/MazF family toxin [Chloroflexota bacterium]
MPNYSKNDVILVQYPFSDFSETKVRPSVIVHAPHPSEDSLIVPLTSRISHLLPSEFVLADWSNAGLNVPSAVKRGVYTVHPSLIIKLVGRLSAQDALSLEQSLRDRFGLF